MVGTLRLWRLLGRNPRLPLLPLPVGGGFTRRRVVPPLPPRGKRPPPLLPPNPPRPPPRKAPSRLRRMPPPPNITSAPITHRISKMVLKSIPSPAAGSACAPTLSAGAGSLAGG